MKRSTVKEYKIEFHVHTRVSKDSFLGKYFLFLMCKLKKINAIAITDHNEVSGAIKCKSFLEKHNINVIIGEEVFTSDGEIIGLFLNERIPPNLSTEETIKEIRNQGGLVYIPHPYDEKRKKTVINPGVLKKVQKSVDFIECYNGRNIKEEFGIEQNKIASSYNSIKIVGSDAHTFYEVGRNYCITREVVTKENIISEIKKAEFHTKKCIKFAHFNTKIVRVLKLIKGGKWNELSRIINRKIRGSR